MRSFVFWLLRRCRRNHLDKHFKQQLWYSRHIFAWLVQKPKVEEIVHISMPQQRTLCIIFSRKTPAAGRDPQASGAVRCGGVRAVWCVGGVFVYRAAERMVSHGGDRASHAGGLSRAGASFIGGGLPQCPEDGLGDGQPEHPQHGFLVRGI